MFNVIRTLRCERTPMFDAARNYTHTNWAIDVEVHYHPVLTAYRIPGQANVPQAPGFAPVATPGALPGETDLALLTRLLQPRGHLKITAGGAIMLETPERIDRTRPRTVANTYACDVKGGPSIDMVSTPQQIGFRHWVVNLHIVADVRDIASGFPQGDSAIISNLWVSNEDINSDRRSVRRFAGRAILRADVMRLANVNANNFRDLFLFACPDHYQRKVVSVSLNEDGTVLDWMFEDTMRGYDLGRGSPILDIECYRTGSVQRGSPLKLVFDTIRGVATAGSGANFQIAGNTVPVGAIAAVAVAALDNLPKSYLHCRCDLTADRNANLGVLTAIALGICQHQIAADSDAGMPLTGSLEITFRQDIADKVYTSVEMSTQFTSEAVLTAAGKFAGAAYDQWGGFNARLAAGLDAAMVELTRRFNMDSRRLEIVTPAGAAGGGSIPKRADPPSHAAVVVVASRQGDVLNVPHFEGPNFPPPAGGDRNNNPPLRQGAFGVVPQETPVGQSFVPPGFIPPAPGSALDPQGADAVGQIPSGIEHLIVQALMGPAELPKEPTTLTTDS